MHAPRIGTRIESWIETSARQWRHGRIVRNRLAERGPALQAALRKATPESVLLVGNSHAEFLGNPDFGGRPSINLGLGGSTAADCATYLAGLRAPARCAAAILIIGTNDIMRWRHPERVGTERRFEAAVRRILRVLDAWAAQVFVASVPPIGAWTAGRDPAAVAAFSDRLEGLCRAGGHSFFDPFAGLRDGGPGCAGTGLACTGLACTGLARTGLDPDGVHLADYTRLAAEVIRLVALDPAPPAPRKRAAVPAGSLRGLHAAAWGLRP